MSRRHPNCKPMTIITDRQPAVSMSGQTRRHVRERLRKEMEAYLAAGGTVTQLESEQLQPVRLPAFNAGGFDL